MKSKKRKKARRVVQAGPVRIASLITEWLITHDLWDDTLVSDAPPGEPPDGLVHVITEGPFFNLLNGYYEDPEGVLDQFSEMLEAQGWWWDLLTGWHMIVQPHEVR